MPSSGISAIYPVSNDNCRLVKNAIVRRNYRGSVSIEKSQSAEFIPTKTPILVERKGEHLWWSSQNTVTQIEAK